MEFALNLLFLAIAACAISHWLICRPSESKLARGTSQGLFILGCALLLVFPSVSITDDLHATFDAIEDVTFSVRKVQPIAPVQDITLPAITPNLDAPTFAVVEWLSAETAAVPRSAVTPT